MSRVLVFCEVSDGEVRKGSRQVLGVASKIGGASVEALIIGENAEEIAPKLGRAGAARVIAVPHDGAYDAATWTAAAAEAVGSDGDCLFLASHTAIAKDFTPRLGARLKCPHIPDAIEMKGEIGSLELKRPIYAGKAFEEIKTEARVVIATLRPNAFEEGEANEGAAAPEVTTQAAPEVPEALKSVVREVQAPETGEIDLTEADVVVSGGMGVNGPEGFEFLRPLCSELGAALGSSRAAVLAGWISSDHQVGQTGKTVSPQLYVACGISGAIQHRAGMSSSKCIVAINKDPDAPIFEIADYGVVGDLFKVVPPFLEAVKKIKAD